MARAKKSKSQLNKEMYEKYKLALEYYDIKLKPLKQPTEKSITKAKQLWKTKTQESKAQGIDNPPTLTQASSYMKSLPLSDEVVDVDDTIVSIELGYYIDSLTSLHGDYLNANRKPTDNEMRNREIVVDRFKAKFNYARQKVGDYELMKALKASDFMGKVEALIYSTHYLYEETEFFDNQIPDMLDAIVDMALDEL